MLTLSDVTVAGRLHNVSFTVPDGARLGVIGRSGAGKTTLISVITGMLTPDSGTCERTGAAAGAVGYIPQDPGSSLMPAMTIADCVTEPIAIRDGTDEARGARGRLPDLFAALGLGSDLIGRTPPELSGGQRQRVAVARALIAQPGIIIADEAFSALDAATRGLIEVEMSGRGTTIILVTHDIPAVRSFCDHVVVLDDGRCVESGPIDLLDDPSHDATRRLTDAARELMA